jgi:hypothetical protein
LFLGTGRSIVRLVRGIPRIRRPNRSGAGFGLRPNGSQNWFSIKRRRMSQTVSFNLVARANDEAIEALKVGDYQRASSIWFNVADVLRRMLTTNSTDVKELEQCCYSRIHVDAVAVASPAEDIYTTFFRVHCSREADIHATPTTEHELNNRQVSLVTAVVLYNLGVLKHVQYHLGCEANTDRHAVLLRCVRRLYDSAMILVLSNDREPNSDECSSPLLHHDSTQAYSLVALAAGPTMATSAVKRLNQPVCAHLALALTHNLRSVHEQLYDIPEYEFYYGLTKKMLDCIIEQVERHDVVHEGNREAQDESETMSRFKDASLGQRDFCKVDVSLQQVVHISTSLLVRGPTILHGAPVA